MKPSLRTHFKKPWAVAGLTLAFVALLGAGPKVEAYFQGGGSVQYNAVPPTATQSPQFLAQQCDINGNLKVNVVAGGGGGGSSYTPTPVMAPAAVNAGGAWTSGSSTPIPTTGIHVFYIDIVPGATASLTYVSAAGTTTITYAQQGILRIAPDASNGVVCTSATFTGTGTLEVLY